MEPAESDLVFAQAANCRTAKGFPMVVQFIDTVTGTNAYIRNPTLPKGPAAKRTSPFRNRVDEFLQLFVLRFEELVQKH